ncbi:hypothetical protein RZA67_00760 [Stenotrophomonas sp. C3(2023)]|uniref:hypothetical protein n=1 Tax=Stenotrophomonas sp. C3(2023) TaxID=3080277 RepID=UPI00293D1491|nr:hypothetical protein [Stenotrophomonas sp. C3(2023)]MDV3467267.1 hypothetical protein [Stenotrophomonas sp. C3(2023)]
MIDALAVQAAVMPATRTLSQPARRRCRGFQHVVVCAAAFVRLGTTLLCAPSQKAGCLRTRGIQGMQRDERMAMMKVPAPHVPPGIGISNQSLLTDFDTLHVSKNDEPFCYGRRCGGSSGPPAYSCAVRSD